MGDDQAAAVLAAIGACEQAAVPGPWQVAHDWDELDLGEHEGPGLPDCPPAGLFLPVPRWRDPGREPRPDDFEYSCFSELPPETVVFIAESRDYVPRLLRAVEAALAPHKPGPYTIAGALCARHESSRHFSITGTEAASVEACPDCPASVYVSCAGCGPHVRLDSCPERARITAALTGEGKPVGT